MLTCSKEDLRFGYRVRLSDGRVAEVDEDTPRDSAVHHESVVVLVDGQQEIVYTSEVCNPEWFTICPVWIIEILSGSKSRAD